MRIIKILFFISLAVYFIGVNTYTESRPFFLMGGLAGLAIAGLLYLYNSNL